MDLSSSSKFLWYSLHAHVVYYLVVLCLVPLSNAAEQHPLGPLDITPPKRVAVIGETPQTVPNLTIDP